ncbi:MAG TPA: tRNA lysidine(34) synthetase TilS [Candidatus Dormibacteraeota bacterium]|nr:tRNA lysidine(34) synthetase TilS [Candidatus Dormibacteraeota bacterium]
MPKPTKERRGIAEPSRGRSGLAGHLLQSIQRDGLITPGERVAVAVSGGADSVALLLLLLEIREKLGVVLSVVHFNHQLRGHAADADERFVAKLAVKYGLPFYAGTTDVGAKARREKRNVEDAARHARYDCFAELVADGRVTRIAVAHTMDDQAETVLAHILRGTSLAGLGGIHPIAGPVVRPLLGYRRAELRSFLKAKKQSWREDVTNTDLTRLRARVRSKLLPLLEKQFRTSAVEHLAALAERAREVETFLGGMAKESFGRTVTLSESGVRILAKDLLSPWPAGHPDKVRALSARLLLDILAHVKKRDGQFTAKHVEGVLQLARTGQSGTWLQLPGGVEVRRERDTLLFFADSSGEKKKTPTSAQHSYEHLIEKFEGETHVRIAELGCDFRLRVIDWPGKRGETKITGVVLDRERLRFPLVLRNWRAGDKLRPLGHRHVHKLKRLLNEKGISRWERDGWPVLTSGGTLAWARGFAAASEFAANERTQKGIVIAEDTF